MLRIISIFGLCLVPISCKQPKNMLHELDIDTENHYGFVLYYYDPNTDCHVCTQDIQLFPELEKAFPEYRFIPVQRPSKMPFAAFEKEMREYGIQTPAADDREGRLIQVFQLEDLPYVIFMTPEGRIVNLRRLTLDIPLNLSFFQKWVQQL
jgi:hypothetical protein